ncbi:four helix bundle protein [Crocinitomix catalasitica]|nr:four helix bundle protein [Crocinitomix catalasitica]
MINTDFVEELKNRTKNFARDIVYFYRDLPRKGEFEVIGKQLLRSATSTAANYRASCRARSQAEFIAKLGIAVEEADESVFWLELADELEFEKGDRIGKLKKEGEEIMKILAASRRTAKANR